VQITKEDRAKIRDAVMRVAGQLPEASVINIVAIRECQWRRKPAVKVVLGPGGRLTRKIEIIAALPPPAGRHVSQDIAHLLTCLIS
jgi:hypothetical protein